MLGIRLDSATEQGLDAIARRTGRPKSQIARDVLRNFVLRDNMDERARTEWRAISLAERSDPDALAMLDGATAALDDDA